MKVITTEEFAKATKIDKLKMRGLAALLMELMKINQVNELFDQAQPKQGPEFADAILKGCGIKVDFDEREAAHREHRRPAAGFVVQHCLITQPEQIVDGVDRQIRTEMVSESAVGAHRQFP